MNPQEQMPNTSHSSFTKFIAISAIVIGFLTTFISGYLLKSLLITEHPAEQITPSPITHVPIQPSSTGTDIPEILQSSTQFLPGKYYFDDTIVFTSIDTPRISLAISARRLQQEKGYIQNTGISFFDGEKWIRKTQSQNTNDSTIVTNDYIKQWEKIIDPSRVLQEEAKATFFVNNTTITVATGPLQNEIGMRSLPGYTKFLSHGNGKITVNGQNHPVHILYTTIYSLNAKDIQFYTQPLGLTTYWLALFDEDGNFYHVDTTIVDKPTEIYKTHQIAIKESKDRSTVTKTFSVSANNDLKENPTNFTFSLGLPIGDTLSVKKINAINKEPNNSYTWLMANVGGSITGQNGTKTAFGILEYIHD